MEKFVNTRLMLRSQGSSNVCGGWLVAVRDNMLVVSLCEERQYEQEETVSVRAVSDNSEADFEAKLIGQQGRTIVLASPNVVRCSHGDSAPRYLVADTAAQLSIDRKIHVGRCLDVSPSGIGMRVAAKMEVGRKYKLTFAAPGYDFQLVAECVHLQQIGHTDYRAGLELQFYGRCDSRRWAKYIEAVARQRKQDMCSTLNLMYNPTVRLKVLAKNDADLKRWVG